MHTCIEMSASAMDACARRCVAPSPRGQIMIAKTLTRLIVAAALAIPAAAGLQVADLRPAWAEVFTPLALRVELAALGGSVLVTQPAIGPFAASPAGLTPGRPRILRITP